jgi:hypothetical protein
VQSDIVQERGSPHGHDISWWQSTIRRGARHQLGDRPGVTRSRRRSQVREVGDRFEGVVELGFGEVSLQ